MLSVVGLKLLCLKLRGELEYLGPDALLPLGRVVERLNELVHFTLIEYALDRAYLL